MTSCQTYLAKELNLRIEVALKGPVYVRFGVCKVTTLPIKGEAAQC